MKRRVAIIFVLSNISFPGPDEKQSPSSLGQDEVRRSHGFPVLWHFGPIIFGETSPRLEEAKAPTNLP